MRQVVHKLTDLSEFVNLGCSVHNVILVAELPRLLPKQRLQFYNQLRAVHVLQHNLKVRPTRPAVVIPLVLHVLINDWNDALRGYPQLVLLWLVGQQQLLQYLDHMLSDIVLHLESSPQVLGFALLPELQLEILAHLTNPLNLLVLDLLKEILRFFFLFEG